LLSCEIDDNQGNSLKYQQEINKAGARNVEFNPRAIRSLRKLDPRKGSLEPQGTIFSKEQISAKIMPRRGIGPAGNTLKIQMVN